MGLHIQIRLERAWTAIQDPKAIPE